MKKLTNYRVLHVLITITAFLTTPSSQSQPSSSWIRYAKTGKEYFEAGSKNFNDASRFCLNLGGKIAQVESKEENEFVRKLASEAGHYCTWLNARNPGKEASQIGSKTYVWMDGSDFSFTNWPPSYPLADFDGVFLCNDEKWHSASYSSYAYVVCERAFVDPLDRIESVLKEMASKLGEVANKMADSLQEKQSMAAFELKLEDLGKRLEEAERVNGVLQASLEFKHDEN